MFSKIDLSCKVPSVSSNSIFDYLDSKSLASARLVSTKWKTSSSEIWKENALKLSHRSKYEIFMEPNERCHV